MTDALCCIASMVKISNKFHHISRRYVQKTAHKQSKIESSTFCWYENIWNFKTTNQI